VRDQDAALRACHLLLTKDGCLIRGRNNDRCVDPSDLPPYETTSGPHHFLAWLSARHSPNRRTYTASLQRWKSSKSLWRGQPTPRQSFSEVSRNVSATREPHGDGHIFRGIGRGDEQRLYRRLCHSSKTRHDSRWSSHEGAVKNTLDWGQGRLREQFRKHEHNRGGGYEQGHAVNAALFADEMTGSPASGLYSVMRNLAYGREIPSVEGLVTVLSHRDVSRRAKLHGGETDRHADIVRPSGRLAAGLPKGPRPSGTIMPVSSVRPVMNSLGSSNPRVG
jgi:hypothetical protein